MKAMTFLLFPVSTPHLFWGYANSTFLLLVSNKNNFYYSYFLSYPFKNTPEHFLCHSNPMNCYFRVCFRPLLLRFTPQVGGAVRCGRLRDQPHPSSLLGGAAGVRPPAGTPPLQLCGILPQIQTALPLQGLPPRPGGAVQRLSIMTGQVKGRHKRIRHRLAGGGELEGTHRPERV